MTDDAPAVSADELTSLIERAPLEAAARGLVVLPAMMATEALVVFPAPEVTLDQALDVAVAGGAPFVTIDVVEFDAAEFADDEDLPQTLITRAAEHDGEPESLLVRWLAAGVPHSFWARAAWHRDLSDDVEEWAGGANEERDREHEVMLARTQALIEAAIADPGIRAAKTTGRKALVESFLRGQRQGADDDAVDYALRLAPARVNDAHREAFALLEATIDQFIADLHDDVEWQRQQWVSTKRRDVLRRFIMTRTGGWAPTEALLKELDNRSFTGRK